MKEQNSYLPIASTDTSRSSAPQATRELIEQEQLPKGSALLLDTILMLARQIQAAGSLEEAKTKAGSIAEQATELIERFNRQIGLAA